jgi:hypothetical protein
MAVLTVDRPLREKLGDEAVDSLVNLINSSLAEQKNDVLKFVEEKFERRLSEEISGLEVRLSEEISGLDVRLSEKISMIDTKLSDKISRIETDLSEKITMEGKRASENKAELIKWMFVFLLGQVWIILGVLFAFFK